MQWASAIIGGIVSEAVGGDKDTVLRLRLVQRRIMML